jgi:hypothetical protein
MWQFFFCYYGKAPSGKLVAVRPVKPNVQVFPDAVAKLSPTFVSIFAEAEEAAQLRLQQIAGPGYRKAFEFLVKDYAKSLRLPESKRSRQSSQARLSQSSSVIREFSR